MGIDDRRCMLPAHNTGPLFLGLNCAHDAAACIVGEAGVLVAIREERLTRRKHHEGFPRHAIAYCLDALGLDSLDSILGAVINQYPKFDCQYELRSLGYTGQLHVNPSHHLLHAFYARHFSGNADGLIVVADGSGYSYAEYKRSGSPMLGPEEVDGDAEEAETVFAVKDGQLSLLQKHWGVWQASVPYFRFPSLGHVYAMAAQHIFGSVRGWIYAGKVMGLAPLGRVSLEIPSVVTYQDSGFTFDLEWAHRLPLVQERLDYWNDSARQDIAARVQHDLENALLAWLADLARDHGSRSLCFTGGVAHNSVANGRISSARHFASHRFTPAADDAGTAIGGALYAFEHILGRQPSGGYSGDFHGRCYGLCEIEAAVRDDRIVLTRFDESMAFARDAAQRLNEGKIIALCDGGSEFSSRALGHRSILCDPRQPLAKDNLNERVKFREPYRPYAVMVLTEHARDFFEITEPSPDMMVVAAVKLDKRNVVPAACHVDGTCRLQTLDESYRGRAGDIVRAFHALTGVPMVINTSLNIRGEPIIETPEEAVECLCTSGLDALYMYPYKVEKHPLSWKFDDPAMLSYTPRLGRGITLMGERASEGGGWSEGSHKIRYRTGREVVLSPEDATLILRIDGHARVANLLAGSSDPHGVMAMLKAFAARGILSFANSN